MIILDTHAWLWWTNESTKLSARAEEAIQEATQLPEDFHGDPADQLIVATSLIHRAPLVSKDQKIQNSDSVKVIW